MEAGSGAQAAPTPKGDGTYVILEKTGAKSYEERARIKAKSKDQAEEKGYALVSKKRAAEDADAARADEEDFKAKPVGPIVAVNERFFEAAEFEEEVETKLKRKA